MSFWGTAAVFCEDQVADEAVDVLRTVTIANGAIKQSNLSLFWPTNQVEIENDTTSDAAKTRGFWSAVVCTGSAHYMEALRHSTSFRKRKLYFFSTFEVGEGSGDNHFLFSYIQLLDKTSALSNSFDILGNISITFPAKVKLKAATKPALMPHYPHYRLCWESQAQKPPIAAVVIGRASVKHWEEEGGDGALKWISQLHAW